MKKNKIKKTLVFLEVLILGFGYCFNQVTAADCRLFAQGDGNCDGVVDDLDYVSWWKSYQKDVGGDFNGDGKTEDLDYVVWWKNYGETAGNQNNPFGLENKCSSDDDCQLVKKELDCLICGDCRVLEFKDYAAVNSEEFAVYHNNWIKENCPWLYECQQANFELEKCQPMPLCPACMPMPPVEFGAKCVDGQCVKKYYDNQEKDQRCLMSKPAEIGACEMLIGFYYDPFENQCRAVSGCRVEGEVPFDTAESGQCAELCIEDETFCQQDEDCLLVDAGCCPCSMGGTKTCINKNYQSEWSENLNCDKNMACLALYRCDSVPNACKCVNNVCDGVRE